LAVDERSGVIFSIRQGTLPWQQILWAKSTSSPHLVVRMTFAMAAPPAHDKKGNCYAERRQTNYLIRWTHANQLSNKLTIINMRLQGYPGGLQSGFALHLVLFYFICFLIVSQSVIIAHCRISKTAPKQKCFEFDGSWTLFLRREVKPSVAIRIFIIHYFSVIRLPALDYAGSQVAFEWE